MLKFFEMENICESYKALLLDYVDGVLEGAKKADLEDHLSRCAACREELEELRQLQTAIDSSQDYEPSANLRFRFEQMLLEEKSKASNVIVLPKRYLRWGLQVAAALLIFWVGMQIGDGGKSEQLTALQQEVKATRQIATLAMMQQPSASKRLQAVLTVNEMETAPDFEVIAALGNRLEHDRQANVRLAAARALGKYGNQREVRDILLHALQNQDDPAVQLAIIDVLVRWKEERAVSPLFKFLQRDSLQSIVRVKAEQGIGELM